MKILLSPAKLMRPFSSDFQPILPFKKETLLLVKELKKWSIEDIAQRMKLSEDKALQTYNDIQNWGKKANLKNAAPALFAYIGEAFKALGAMQLSENELAYLQNSLYIMSGLYGLIQPKDLIEPYRLEMAQRGVTPIGTSLYMFWRPTIEKYLLKQLHTEEQILNLASSEYSDLIQDKQLRNCMITPHFLEKTPNKLKSVSVFSKQARGTMARWCAVHSINHINEVKSFKELGYSYSAQHSDAFNWIFIR